MKPLPLLRRLFISLHLMMWLLMLSPRVQAASPAATPFDKPLTIMPLGDSITEGGSSFSCYRYPLLEKLTAGGYKIEYVGSRSSQTRAGLLHHEGYGGKTAEFLAANIERLYKAHPADLVLLHAGHNHFIEEKPVGSILAATEKIVTTIHAIRPDATVLVAQVITSGKLPKYAYLPELNTRLAGLVSRLAASGQRVALVNQAEGFDWHTDSIADHVHPNPQGAEKMAARWYEALAKVLPRPGPASRPGAITPLSVSANHRYLQDAEGRPFFLVGDCPQNLPLKLAVSEFDPYMADCEQKGFNLLWICIDGQRGYSPTTQPPVDRNHQPMMKTGWDIGTLNEAYLKTIDAILDAAERHGIYCMLTPLSECQWTQANIKSNPPAKWQEFGRTLGGRYKNRASIIWQMGNDTLNTDAQHAIVRGLKAAGDTHLMTVNWRPGHHKLGSPWVRKHQFGEDWVDLDAWYENAPTRESGVACYWQKIEYQRPDPMPSFLSEGPYQHPDTKGATDLDIRKLNYYVALGGGCGGHVYGAGWLADPWDYASYRDNGGRVQTIHFKNLLVSRDWTSLVPDYDHTFITAGYGTLAPNTQDYVGAAINQGMLGLAYCPQAATITADLSKLAGPVTAQWYDPANGKYQAIAGSPFAPAGAHQFTTPGANSAGSTDWVLVLESPRPN